jgi:very-short-patch-repair endonuclease
MSKINIHNLASNLRKAQTPAEQLLWSKLRAPDLSGYKFRRQHPFENYILDFYCSEAKLAIELDGGDHSAIQNMNRDKERTSKLQKNGIRVIRFWNHEVLTNLDEVIMEIDAILQEITVQEEDKNI